MILTVEGTDVHEVCCWKLLQYLCGIVSAKNVHDHVPYCVINSTDDRTYLVGSHLVLKTGFALLTNR